MKRFWVLFLFCILFMSCSIPSKIIINNTSSFDLQFKQPKDETIYSINKNDTIIIPIVTNSYPKLQFTNNEPVQTNMNGPCSIVIFDCLKYNLNIKNNSSETVIIKIANSPYTGELTIPGKTELKDIFIYTSYPIIECNSNFQLTKNSNTFYLLII